MIKKAVLFSLFTTFYITSCTYHQEEPVSFDEGVNAEILYPQDQRLIRTPDGANALDLETPLRCNVNWQTQQMLLTLPFNTSSYLAQLSL